MTHCGSPGMCGKQADCADTHCPGRWMQDERITTPDEMLFLTALVGGLAVICIVGLVGWLGYFVWPVLRAYINTF